MSGTETQIESKKPRQLPGHLLMQARERLSLAQKDIASQLNLQIETIDALENDAKDRLPVAAYVRGYIRSYARLVKLDADMLIRLYEQESSSLPEIIPNITKPTQASSRDKPVRAVTYLITFILALLLLAWLQSKYISGKKPATATGHTQTDERLNTQIQGAGPDTATAAANRTKPSAPVEEVPLTLPPQRDEITESIITETESQDVPVIDTDLTGTTPPGPAEITESLTIAEDKLQLLVIRDSWIEVYDAGRNKLYHGLARSGSEVDLAGRAPFSVLLGYAPGVEVRFNNEIFDTAPFANAGIARFTLGTADN